jgi:hypothetical protein
MVMFTLLDIGIPWDVIANMPTHDVYTALGVHGAIKQKQQEDQDAANRAATAKSHMKGFR